MNEQDQTPTAKADVATAKPSRKTKKVRHPGKKSWLRRIAWTSFLILAILGAGLYAGIQYLNSPAAKERIIAQIESATGRDVTIEGGITVAASLKPAVELNGFSMSNAEWAKKDPMVSAKQVRVVISLLPLLQKDISIHEVILIEPTVRLAINKDGHPNWQFKPVAEQTADAETASEDTIDTPNKQTSIQLDHVNIQNGLLRFDDYRTNQQHKLNLKVLDIKENQSLDKLTAKLQGQYQGVSLSLDTTTAAINTLLQQQDTVSLTALATVGKNTLQLDGELQFSAATESDEKPAPAYQGAVTAEIVDQAALTNIAPAINSDQLAAIGRVNLHTTGLMSASRVNLSSLKLSTSWLSLNGAIDVTLPAANITAKLDGTLKDLTPIKTLLKKEDLPVAPGSLQFRTNFTKQGQQVSIPSLAINGENIDLTGTKLKIQLPAGKKLLGIGGALQASSDNLGALVKQPGYEGRALSLNTALDFANNKIDTKDLTLTLGNTTIKGNIDAKLSSTKGTLPAVNFTLTSPAVYADDLMPAKTATAEAPAAPAPKAKKKGPLFSTKPINVDVLKTITANGNISVEKLYLPNYAAAAEADQVKKLYENIKLSLNANRGDVKLSDVSVRLPGNTRVQATARLNASNATPTAAADVLIGNLQLGDFLKFWAGSNMVSDGPTTIRTNLTTVGKSPAAMAANLNGESSVVIGEMTLASGYVELLADDLVQNILPFMRKASSETRVNCLVTRWPIKNGVATTDVTVMDTKRITLTGTGSINLGSETLDVTFLPQPKDASLVSLSAPIKISGPLTKPKVRPDVGKVATDVLQAVALGAINPLAAVVPFVSFGDDQDVCGSILTNNNGQMAIDDAGLKKAKQQGAKALSEGKGPLQQILDINPVNGVRNAMKGVGSAIQGIVPGALSSGDKGNGKQAPEKAIKEMTEGITKSLPKDVQENLQKQLPDGLPEDISPENLTEGLSKGLGKALFGAGEKPAE